MKKWLIAALILLLLLSAVYIFIPSTITITTSAKIKCTAAGARRVLASENKWMQWWPAGQTNTKAFAYQGAAYKLNNYYFNNFEIFITENNEKFASSLNILPLNADSVYLDWQCRLSAGLNPFMRIKKYRQSQEIENNMAGVLQHLQLFLSKKENIYNMVIEQQQVKDTILMSTKKIFAHYPSTVEIYQMLNEVKACINQKGGKETGYPMLHVQPLKGTQFQTMVAIPVDKILTDTNNIVFKRMVPGKILVTQAKGGDSNINQTFAMLQHYVDDYNLQSPAIPFQSLITNRQLETDTSKWITKLYYPIF